MGQIKNIKLHIVTDIKDQSNLNNTKCRNGEEVRNVVDATRQCTRTKRSSQQDTRGTNEDVSRARIVTNHWTQILLQRESRREVSEAKYSAKVVMGRTSDPKDSDMEGALELLPTLESEENEEQNERMIASTSFY